jgi:hypothetical protein
MVSDDAIEIDLANKTLIVNRVPIPLAQKPSATAANSSRSRNPSPGGFTLSSCHGDLLYARLVGDGHNKREDTLQLELPLNGLLLDIHSADEIIIKVRTQFIYPFPSIIRPAKKNFDGYIAIGHPRDTLYY